jgi:peroxiredoxin
MPIRKHPWTRLLMVLLLAACVGCGGKTGENQTGAPDDGVPVKTKKTVKKTTPTGYKPKPEEPPKIPTVVLSKEFEEKCRVFQGQQMPDAELTDLAGNAKELKSLYGGKLTVVCFWSAGAAEGRQRIGLRQVLADLAETTDKYKAPEVQVLGVNVKDPPEVAGKLLKEAKVEFANMLDPQGALFDKIGTNALPRIYLLDAGGKILWFDLLQLTSFDSSLRQLEFAIKIAIKPEGEEDHENTKARKTTKKN